MTEETSEKLSVYDKILKAVQVLGFPTVIVGALFYFLGGEVWPFFKAQLQESVNMQRAVTEAIQLQSVSQSRDAASHEKVAEALESTTKYVTSNGENIRANGEVIRSNTIVVQKLLKMMEDDDILMKDMPKQRDEMIKLLEQIVIEQKKAAKILDEKLVPSVSPVPK